MAFFEDLSPYCYRHPEREQAGTVNIGWLEAAHPFSAGETSVEFQDKLKQICLTPVNQTRGFHSCGFCHGRDRPQGSAEIRVQGVNKVYVAPSLVHHYVVQHGYKPPQEFIEAVLACEN
jgi:hypothetical protein